MLRTASLRLLAGITAALVAASGIGHGTALAEEAPDGYIEGVVTAPAGTALDRLQVQILEMQSPSVYSTVSVGADGRFRAPYSWLDYANVKVVAGDTGLADTWYGNVSRQEDSLNIPVHKRDLTGVDIAMAKGSSLTGKVSVPSGTDISKLTVVAESQFITPSGAKRTASAYSTAVAADGTYKVPGLGANAYTVRVQPGANPLLESWYGSGQDKAATRVLQVAAEQTVSGIDLELTKPGSVSGTAMFPPGSTPEPGYVAFYSAKGNRIAGGTFGVDGTFHVPQVPAGASRVAFGITSENTSSARMWYPETGDHGAAETLNLGQGEARTGLTLTLQPAGSIAGNVSGTAGAPVGVRALDSQGRIAASTTTDASGNYVLGRLGPGAFKVRFGGPGLSTTPYMPHFYPGIPESAGYLAGADVTVSIGQTTPGVNAAMTMGGSISGTVLNQEGNPMNGHSVHAISLNGIMEEREFRTDGQGTFVISGLADGDYILETNRSPLYYQIPWGHVYSGNVTSRAKAQTITIKNSQAVEAGTLSYATAGKEPSSAAGKFVPVAPTRILDTRAAAPFGTGTRAVLQVGGKAGIPMDAGAVALNLTVTEPSSYGHAYATLFGEPYPQTSNVNYDQQETIPNYVIVPMKDGRITLGNSSDGTAHMIADVAGYFTGGMPLDSGGYTPVAPFRAADNRDTYGILGGQQLDVDLAGQRGLPADIGAVIVNITATRVWSDSKLWPSGVPVATSYGHLTAFASGTPKPATSNVNYHSATGDTPNLAIVPVGADGKISIANTSPGPVGVIVDVMGYFRKGEATAAGTFQSVAPKRLLDTRQSPAPVGAGKDISVTVAGANAIPAGAKAAMVNLTATEPKSYGHLTAYPTGKSLPATSNVNYSQGQTVANYAVVPIGADGKITIRNTSGEQTHVIVDVSGYIFG